MVRSGSFGHFCEPRTGPSVRFSDFAEPRTGPLVWFKTVWFRFSMCLNHEPDLVATIFLILNHAVITQMCPFYSTLSIIALASLSQLLYWGVHHIDMCLTFLLYNQRCDNHVGEAQYLLQKLQARHHSTMYGGRHLPFVYPAGGCAVARCLLDEIGTERETCQRGPTGPLFKPTHPHQAAFDHILQQSVPRSVL